MNSSAYPPCRFAKSKNPPRPIGRGGFQQGVRGGAPRSAEWFGAFGLLVTLVWLYLEMLRLLSRLQRR